MCLKGLVPGAEGFVEELCVEEVGMLKERAHSRLAVCRSNELDHVLLRQDPSTSTLVEFGLAEQTSALNNGGYNCNYPA